MKKMTSIEIRNMWLKFFESKGHSIISSAPLVPIDDDSLLWINAGVTPLKKYFDGSVIPSNRRLTNIQKCIRTNDIENVGLTKRHQTFFEMMGNFSIGDYFRNEAIEFAFELLTSDKWFNIPVEKLYVTYYPDDVETYNKWVSLGLDKEHLIPLKENFWEIGEGPCGPDTEIFYDRGEKYDPNHDALEKFKNDEDNERYIEIWNNVFSQYNSKAGVKREDYEELPHKNIDTGAGLERWACVFQDVDSNFDTDLFVPIINHIEDITGYLYNGQMEFKVIADHIRAVTFALADGAHFENVGRGYVLRRLLRRSVRMARRLGVNEPFMYKLVGDVCDIMGSFYKEIVENRSTIQAMILEEEELFHKTLASGEKKLYELMDNSPDKTISGHDAFKLYDTYGFPFELTLEYLEEKGFSVSKEEFDKYMMAQKTLAKSSRKQDSIMNKQNEVLMNFTKKSVFKYNSYKTKGQIIFLFDGEKEVSSLTKEGYVILDKTCFYAESGGQVSDTGMITCKSFKARVLDVTKTPNGQHIHKVKVLDGKILKNDKCDLIVDKERRMDIEANHSSVHLLQYALRSIISSDIKQAGSKVTDEYLRFDFTYNGKIDDELIVKVEDKVNQMIMDSIPQETVEMSLEDAKKSGAMALFSEKYQDMVRVVNIGDSHELCGGTHISNTKDIKKMAILSLESKGSHVYRIEAVTKGRVENALFKVIKPYNDEMIKLLMKAKNIINTAKKEKIDLTFDVQIDNSKPTSYKDLIFNRNELEYIQTEVKNLEKAYLLEKEKKALNDLDAFMENVEEINGIKTIIMKVNNYEINLLKSIMDALLNKLGKGFIFIANIKDNNVNFLSRSNTYNAAYAVKEASMRSNGNGGGSPTFAQGGGKTIETLDDIIKDLKQDIK